MFPSVKSFFFFMESLAMVGDNPIEITYTLHPVSPMVVFCKTLAQNHRQETDSDVISWYVLRLLNFSSCVCVYVYWGWLPCSIYVSRFAYSPTRVKYRTTPSQRYLRLPFPSLSHLPLSQSFPSLKQPWRLFMSIIWHFKNIVYRDECRDAHL